MRQVGLFLSLVVVTVLTFLPSMAIGAAVVAPSSGEAGSWRTAAFILFALVIIAVVALARREHHTLGMLLVLGAGALVIVGVAFLQAHVASQPGSSSAMDMNAMSDLRGEGAPTVTTVTVQRASGSVESSVWAPGTLAPYLVQDIVTRAPGVLRDFSAYVGDHVRTGQVLAHLDEPELIARAGASAADARAQAAAADAAAIEAQQNAPNAVRIAREDLAAKAAQQRYWSGELGRERSLLAGGAISQQEYEDERAQAAVADAALLSARSTVGTAMASVLMARAQEANQRAQARRAVDAGQADAVMLDYTRVIVPSDGIILKRLVDPGTSVQAGTTIARVAVLDRLRVQANVAQEDLSLLSVGTLIDVYPDGSHARALHGRVTSIAPVADAMTHTTSVEAIIEHPGSLVPGAYVRVALHGRIRIPSDALRVPTAAVVSGGEGGAAVWRIAAQSAHRIPVDLLSGEGTMAVVRADTLHAGDRVALDPGASLEEGESVIQRGVAPR